MPKVNHAMIWKEWEKFTLPIEKLYNIYIFKINLLRTKQENEKQKDYYIYCPLFHYMKMISCFMKSVGTRLAKELPRPTIRAAYCCHFNKADTAICPSGMHSFTTVAQSKCGRNLSQLATLLILLLACEESSLSSSHVCSK